MVKCILEHTMNRFGSSSTDHQQIQVVQTKYHPILPSKISITSKNSSTSLSSLILNIFPLPTELHSQTLMCEYSATSVANTAKHLHENTSLCKICQKHESLKHDGIDMCDQCYQATLKSNPFSFPSTKQCPDNAIFRSTVYTEQTCIKDEQNILKTNEKKVSIDISGKESKAGLKSDSCTLLSSSDQQCESNIDSLTTKLHDHSQSCLVQLILRPQLHPEQVSGENRPIPLNTPAPIQDPDPVPVTESDPPQRLLSLSVEQIRFYEKLEKEYYNTAEKLIEYLKRKTKESIDQLLKYWSLSKQCCLDQMYDKTNHNQFVDYILKSLVANKEFQNYLDQNDEIRVTLQILSAVLATVPDKYPLSEIKQIFDNAEYEILSNVHSKHEGLISSYIDTLSITHTCSLSYQSRLDGKNAYRWIETIEKDYRCLIQKVSNASVENLPEVEKILLEMLLNVKKRLYDKNISGHH